MTYLRALGFHVNRVVHVPGDPSDLYRILKADDAAKTLHGLYFWGHGDSRGLTQASE